MEREIIVIKDKYFEVKLNPENFESGPIKLEYYLLKGIYKNEDNGKNINTYGLGIIKRDDLNNQTADIEEEFIPHLSIFKSKVEDILNVLSRNTVTPMCLHAVLDNLVGVKC